MNRRRSDKSKRTGRRRETNVDASEIVRRSKTVLIIDGYNLMHVTRFAPVSQTEGELRRCREGLLSLLASHLSSSGHRKITVVFDSENAPKHLPDQQTWRHLHVVFARQENSADDLIAKMIAQQANPKQLVVVSSDHRVQVAAQRRRATPIDSDIWFDAVLELPASTEKNTSPDVENEPKLSSDDLKAFRDAMSEPVEIDEPTDDEDDAAVEFENPFPSGYFDDLEE